KLQGRRVSLEGEMCVVCVSIPLPPLCIYRREPRDRSAGLLGQPASQWAHRPCILACGSLLGPTCQWHGVYLLSCRFLALVGPILHILTRVTSRFAGTLCLGLNHTIMLLN